MYLRIHESMGKRMVAVCDEDLLGRVLEEGGVCLDLDRYRNFYCGKKATKEEVEAALKSFDSANLVGKSAVNVALHMKLIKKADIMYINSIPYIQLYII